MVRRSSGTHDLTAWIDRVERNPEPSQHPTKPAIPGTGPIDEFDCPFQIRSEMSQNLPHDRGYGQPW